MPSAVREMVIDFGLQNPACFSATGLFQTPFNGCPPTDMFQNFYCTKKVGHYLIGKTLGEGSFAKVREGLHVVTDEKVAIKVIDKHKVKYDEYMVKNLYREGRIQQMIRHPNIAQLLDVMETDNNYYLVTELCLGGNLMNRIYDRKHLEEWEVQKYIRQLIMAVEHLHRAGVVHRDLKIENLLLDENDNIKLIDFGLSNSAGVLGYTDPFSTQCGSPAYAAPEIIKGDMYGPKVDIWSIGVNMYAMLTGMLPFAMEPFSLTLLHERMVNKEITPLPPHISPEAKVLVMSLLEPDPANRPSIRQVVTNPWVHGGQLPTNVSYLNRIHNRDINHVVVSHMTEKLGYKYSDVLSTINSNRASGVLATYFLLNKKMERLFKVNMEPAEKPKTAEPSQLRWATANEKPSQEPAYLAAMKTQPQDSAQNPGILHPAINGRESDLYMRGTVPSSSRINMDINPFFLRTPLTDLRHLRHRLETQTLLVGGPVQGRLGIPTNSRVMGVPTNSRVIGVPTNSQFMGVPTSSRVMGVPTNSQFTGIPTNSQFMGIPTNSQFMGVPTSSRDMGVPTNSQFMGIPTSSRVMGVPTNSQFMGIPTSSRAIGVPTNSQFMGIPTSSRVIGVPTSSRDMGVPTNSQFMGVPTSSRVMGVPTNSQFMGVPTSSRDMGVPTNSQFMGIPTSSRVMGVPTNSQFMGIPTSSRVVGVPTSSQFMGVPTSSRVIGVPTSSRVMGVPTNSQFMGIPTSSRVVGVPTSSRVVGVPTSSQFMGVPTSSRVIGVPTSSRVMGVPTSSRVMGVPTSSRVMGVPTSSRVMGVPTSSRVMGVPTSSRVMGVPTSSRVMGNSWDTSYQGNNARVQQAPPWLRFVNGPHSILNQIQRKAPNPSATPTPNPSPLTHDPTRLGVQARLNAGYTDRHQDRLPAMGIAQILKKHDPPPGPRFRPRMEPTPSHMLSTYHMQTLPNHAGALRTIF